MKDLGQLTYFLGLEVHHRSNGIFLNQQKYIQDLIKLAGLAGTTSVDTPMEVNVKYKKDEGDLLPNPTHRRLVGSLIYLTTTRPDILYVVHQVSQFMSSPRRIIRYLKGSSTRGLFFPKASSLQLMAYSDADWAGCPDTRRSTTGWCMFLGDALISWKCKKQDRVLNLLLRLNIVQCQLLVLKLCGYVVFWTILGFPNLHLHLFMQTIQVLFRLLQI